VKRFLAAAIIGCSLPHAADAATVGPTGVATLSSFVGQWTCVNASAGRASIWTIAYEEDGQALHIAISSPATGGGVSRRDVFIVGHAPQDDLYAFGLGSAGWEFSRSAAFDGKSLSFASLQTADGAPVTHTLEIQTPLSFNATTSSVLPTGANVSTTESCTKA
jgi:hypothetical protein